MEQEGDSAATIAVGQPRPWGDRDALRFHPENRRVTVAGTALLVNPVTGGWIRLSSRGGRLLELLEAGADPAGAFAAGEVGAFVECLVGRGFAAHPRAAAPRRAGATTSKGGPEDAPLARVVLNVTRSCNLRCRHCAVYAGVGPARSHVASRRAAGRPAAGADEPTDAILRLLALLAERGTQAMVLFGGEPLLRRDIAGILAFAADRIPRVGLFTNGTLLADPSVVSDDLCRLLVERVPEVHISLDGSRAEVNDAMRGAGSFARTVRGIQRLMGMGHRGVVVKPVLTRDNLGDVPNLVKLAKRLGVALDLGIFVPIGMGAVHRHELLPGHDELLRAYQRIWLLAEYFDLASASFNSFCRPFMGRAATHCGAGQGYVLVDCSGDVFPCEGLQDGPLCLGNLLDPGMAGVRPVAEAFDASVDRQPACSACELRYFCKGGCAAEAYGGPRNGGPASSLCGLYRRLLPGIVSRYEPEAPSWRNLRQVFEGGPDFSLVEEYLGGGSTI